MLKLGKLADYGTMIVTVLAADPARMYSAQDLAARTHVSAPTVSKLLKQLTKGGLVESLRGAHGGYKLARPAGPGWRAQRAAATGTAPPDRLNLPFLGWLAGCAFVYSALFGMGHVLLGHHAAAIVSILVFAASGAALARIVPKLWVK